MSVQCDHADCKQSTSSACLHGNAKEVAAERARIIAELEGECAELREKLAARQPYRCPVCDGVGMVSGYCSHAGDVPTWTVGSTAVSEICRSCKGTGVIWGGQDAP